MIPVNFLIKIRSEGLTRQCFAEARAQLMKSEFWEDKRLVVNQRRCP
ncbi:hypothetical protein DB30_00993 [Enhygromyxa salina]|uniref:Uncharacterized protein n=1 Tax=Enhygromyxa salina TaxID=215803 RepID=A0A0C2CT96_9BACT|nr:hypothetical protein DB30_00993 [Enhygromyxa salina]